MCAAIQVCRYFNGVVEAMLDLACGSPPRVIVGRLGSPYPNTAFHKQALFFDLHELPDEWYAKEQQHHDDA
jgi:hypothetical protein